MVIIVRGACSVGKTTVARELVERLPGSAHVGCDTMLPWMADATLAALQKQGKEAFPELLNAWVAATSRIFAEQGIRLVVDWHFPADEELQDLLQRLDDCQVFNLLCAPEEHLRRDRQRATEEQIGPDGVEYFRTQGSWVGSPHGTDVDTTAMSPSEVATAILGHLGETR